MASSLAPLSTADDRSEYPDTSSSASVTPPDSATFRPRSSWLSNFSASSTASHRSSFSSAASDHHPFSSPKPHKANQAAWEAMKRLRRDSGGRVGLEHFRLLRRVGSGDIGSVYLCQIRNPAVGPAQGFYAMKVVDREAVAARKKLGRAETEREILCMLDHPFLPTLYADFDASHYSCLVMEFCPGGDLYSARFKLPSRRFPISSAKFYAAETLLALEYLHMMGIVYRDLKPENVLVREDGHIMLSDFDLSLKCDVVPKLLKQTLPPSEDENHSHCSCSGSSIHHTHPHKPTVTTCIGGPLHPALSSCFSLRRHLSLKRSSSSALTTTITEHANGTGPTTTTNKKCNDPRTRMEVVMEPIEARSKSFVGTHEYLAPEVISGQGHGSAVDWWTFGIFLYEMLFGMTPFKGPNNEQTLKNILKQSLRFPNGSISSCTKEHEEMETAKDLIRKLLVKNPKKRIGSVNGSVEIKRHEFFNGVNWALIRSVRPPMVPAEEAHNRKVSAMMKKKGGGGGGGGSGNVGRNMAAPAALLVVPKALSKKERDQPYQIPAHLHDHNYHHSHHFDYF